MFFNVGYLSTYANVATFYINEHFSHVMLGS